MRIILDINGTRPMLQHNGRLANPLDPWTRKVAAITAKRKRTDEDMADLMWTEARGSCWETPDEYLGLPNAAVWRCLYDAATAFKRGQDLKRALSFEDVTVPLLVGGQTVLCDDFLKDADNIDYRPVKLMGRKTMRARPRIAEWASRHEFALLTDVIDFRDLIPIVERAGRLVGIAEWRPIYGTFDGVLKEAA